MVSLSRCLTFLLSAIVACFSVMSWLFLLCWWAVVATVISVTGIAATTVYLWCMMLCFDELLCIIHESAIASVRLVFSSCYADAIAHWVEY
jgi:hypothetical protein